MCSIESSGRVTAFPEADRYATDPTSGARLDRVAASHAHEEVDAFVADGSGDAYERMIDRLLAKEALRRAHGPHVARSGPLCRLGRLRRRSAADDLGVSRLCDPGFNANTPFDQFTVDQIAGDLLPAPMEEQLIATAFHRNTLTNNEGGTSDEEFRNVAIVDRVNTTMAVWMGTTIGVRPVPQPQVRPMTQEDYFRMFVLQQLGDADQTRRSPLLDLFTPTSCGMKPNGNNGSLNLKRFSAHPRRNSPRPRRRGPPNSTTEPTWTVLHPATLTAETDAGLTADDSGLITASIPTDTNAYTLRVPSARRKR